MYQSRVFSMRIILLVLLELVLVLSIQNHSDVKHLMVAGWSKYLPKILLIDNSHSPKNNNSYDYYVKDFQYALTEEQKDLLQISCFSIAPIQWRWKNEAETLKPKVTKERRQINASFVLYISNLTITLAGSSEPVQTNFSCVSLLEIEKPWAIQNVACVEVETPKSKLRVFDGIYLKNCSAQLRPLAKEISSNCSANLTIDNFEAKCQRHDAHKLECVDLDSCFNINPTCAKNDSYNTSELGSPFLLKHAVFPFIVYCIKRYDFQMPEDWKAYVILFPSVKENAWTNFSFYRNIKQARHNKSVQLYALPPEKTSVELSELKRLPNRNKFANGEPVVFLCVAVEYLFMKGFQWLINDTVLPEYSSDLENAGNGTKDISVLGVYMLQRTLLMNSTTLGPSFQMSCRAPIWNSKEFMQPTLNVSLFSSKAPRANLSCVENAKMINCSCLYEGWPRPKVLWDSNFSIIMLKTLPNFTSDSEISDETTHPHNKSWESHRIFKNPNISPSLPLVITCEVENFVEKLKCVQQIRSGKAASTWQWYFVVAPLVAVCVLAGVMILFMYWKNQKNLETYAARKQNLLTADEIKEFYSGCSHTSTECEALLLPYNSEYEIPMDELTLDGTILGSGQFGLVLKGMIGSLPVAVKTIKPTADIIYFKSLLSELKILQFVGTHQNIVNLIGANTVNIKKREVFLVLDFCSNGSLVDFLRLCREKYVDFFKDSWRGENQWPLYVNSTEIILTTDNLIRFSTEIASALDHLASKNVIHGDLAARNILVTDDLHAKVCDFGLSKQLLHYTVYVQKIDCPLPLRWMALESLQDMEFSLASDKWSYGVVLWEIFSLGELPYPGEQWSFESYRMLQEGYRMAKPHFANDSIYRLMLELWKAKPQQRPSYEHVISHLKKEAEMLT